MNAMSEQNALRLVQRLLDPEDLGYAANPEIRDAARRVLGYAPVETKRRTHEPPRRNPGPHIQQPQMETRGWTKPLEPETHGKRTNTGQSRLHSLIESLANVAIGYAIALASQLVIFPRYGIHIPLSSNVAIGLWFTLVSVVRSYAVRRWFNGGMKRFLSYFPGRTAK